jgi:hypothetical protein
LATLADITNSNKKELYKAEGIDDLFNDPITELRETQYKLSSVVRDGTDSVQNCREREKDILYLVDLTKLVGLQLHAVTEDSIEVGKERTEFQSKASQEEGVLKKTKAKVLQLEHEAEYVEVASNKLEAYNEMVKDALMDYDAVALELEQCKLRYEDLEVREKCLKRQFDALSSQIATMKRGEVGMNLRPRPLCSQFDPRAVSNSDTISLTPCALCYSGFPRKDIIVCTCGHLYHPWCAGVWFGVSSNCAHTSCGATVHPAWFTSFGFGKLHAVLQQLAQSLKLQEEQERLLETLTSTVLDSHPSIGTQFCPVQYSLATTFVLFSTNSI